MLTNSSILITGGTGSFAKTFIPMTIKKYKPERLVILSRDEMKHWEMAKLLKNDPRVRFLIGDVRDKDRLYRALDGVDYVVPGNDDAIKSVTLFVEYFGSAVMEGTSGSKAKVKAGSSEPGRDASLEKEIIEKFANDIDLQGEETEETTEETTEE